MTGVAVYPSTDETTTGLREGGNLWGPPHEGCNRLHCGTIGAHSPSAIKRLVLNYSKFYKNTRKETFEKERAITNLLACITDSEQSSCTSNSDCPKDKLCVASLGQCLHGICVTRLLIHLSIQPKPLTTSLPIFWTTALQISGAVNSIPADSDDGLSDTHLHKSMNGTLITTLKWGENPKFYGLIFACIPQNCCITTSDHAEDFVATNATHIFGLPLFSFENR